MEKIVIEQIIVEQIRDSTWALESDLFIVNDLTGIGIRKTTDATSVQFIETLEKCAEVLFLFVFRQRGCCTRRGSRAKEGANLHPSSEAGLICPPNLGTKLGLGGRGRPRRTGSGGFGPAAALAEAFYQ